MDALHRIEPSLVNTPMFFGSAGEPTLGPLPDVSSFSRYQGFTPGSLSPLFMGPLAAILFSPNSAGDAPQSENVRSVSGVVRHPLNFDNLPFGKAFALARSLGLDQFHWRANPYTTKLK